MKGNNDNNQLKGEDKDCNESEKLFPFSHNFEENNFKESEISFFDRDLNYSIVSKKGNDDNKQPKEEEKEYKIKTYYIYFNHFSKQNISLEGFNHFKLFNTQSIEKRKKVKRNKLKRKEENNEFLKRKRKNKKKPGRKTNCFKPKYSHTSLDLHNLQVKINNYFLNFLINLSNDIISCELGKNIMGPPDIASTIVGAIASIIDAIFGKAKIYKLFLDFCFAKIVNYFLILIV